VGIRERQENCQAENHADRSDPITKSDSATVFQGDAGEDEHELSGNDRLHHRQRTRFERGELKDESEDHAGDPQEPNGLL
jgi:hypothetical protein